MRTPLFSLGVITFNSERTILETLDSLVSLRGREALELRITDDASGDGTRGIIDAWVDRHRKEFFSVSTLYFSENQGVSRAHTATFQEAQGVWGLYLGGDDLISTADFFLQLSQKLAGRSEHIFRTRVKEFYPDTGDQIDFVDSYRFLLRLSAQRQFRYLGGTGLPFRSGPGTVFRIETLRKLDAFGTYNRDFEDWQMFLRFCRSGYRIGFLDVEGVLWRRHPGQHSARAAQRMKLANRAVKLREVIPYLNRLSLFERWKFRHSGRWSQRFNRIYIRYLDVWGRIFS